MIDEREAGDFYDRPLTEPWLFHFTTRDLRLAPHAGPFSLKFVVRGQERYSFGSRQLCLSSGQLLFSAADRTYSSEISTPSECISLFLPAAIASDAWFGSTGDHERIIDGARRLTGVPVPVAFAASRNVRLLVTGLLSALRSGNRAHNLAFEVVSEAAQQWRSAAPVAK